VMWPFSYSRCARLIVVCDENRSFRLASCCSVDVRNGAAGRRVHDRVHEVCDALGRFLHVIHVLLWNFLAAVALLIIPLAAAMVERRETHAHLFVQSAGQAMHEALGHRGYVLLTVGFFVCGFQIVFVGVHLPAYLADRGLPAHVAVMALALVGLFNIVGTYAAGWLGGRMSKKYILSFIYFARSVVFALFFFLPLSAFSVYAFAIALGLLWLSTVPPTNSLVAQIFGVRYLAMLSGFVFFSHQIGSFLGAWLGGKLYDTTGSYDIVWYLSIALGIAAGLINLPIDERAIKRPVVQPA